MYTHAQTSSSPRAPRAAAAAGARRCRVVRLLRGAGAGRLPQHSVRVVPDRSLSQTVPIFVGYYASAVAGNRGLPLRRELSSPRRAARYLPAATREVAQGHARLITPRNIAMMRHLSGCAVTSAERRARPVHSFLPFTSKNHGNKNVPTVKMELCLQYVFMTSRIRVETHARSCVTLSVLRIAIPHRFRSRGMFAGLISLRRDPAGSRVVYSFFMEFKITNNR